MKKITTLFSALVLTAFGWQANAQILNQSAGWPNATWTLGGTYDVPSLLSDPTTTANFSFDDDNAASGSVDAVYAESPVIDLTVANAGGETWININGNFDYYELGDALTIEYWDVDAASWIVLDAMAGNTTTVSDYTSCVNTGAYTTTTLNIVGFTSTQLTGFKYRINYDDAGGWMYGFCFDSPTIVSSMPPSCPTPTVLAVSNMTTTSVDLGWTENGTATTWDIEYGATPYTFTGTPTITGTTTNPHNLTGLTASTSYEYYVRADCGGGTSTWAGPFAFYTGYCTPSSSAVDTYIDDFTTTNGSVNISNLTSGYTTGGYFDGTAQSVQSFATGTFDFNAVIVGGTVGAAIWVDWNNDLVFDDATEKVFVTSGYGSGPFSGTVTIPGGTAIGNYTMRMMVHFNSSVPNDPCASNSRLEVEDYTIDVIAAPTCLPPAVLTATNVTATSADLGWTENGTATTWDVEYGATPYTFTGTPTITGTTTNPHNLTGLTASTSYEYYVRADCGGGTSTWAGPFMFNTSIQTPTGVTCTTGSATFIFTEDFDVQGSWTGDISGTETNGDWILPQSGTTTSSSTGPDTAYSNTNYVYYEASGSTTDTASLISPVIDLSNAANEAELSFWMHAYGANMSTLKVGVSTSATGPFTTVFTQVGQLQTAGTDAWQAVGVNLNAYVGQMIYIEFNYYATGGYEADMALDLVKVETCDIPTGVNAIAKNVNLTVYPNPTTGVFNLNVNTTDVNELNIKVMNMQGQVVFAKNNFNNIANVKEQIDLSENANGIYFVTVTTDKGVITHKVVVQ